MKKSVVAVFGLVLGVTACTMPAPGNLDQRTIRSEANLRTEVVLEEINFPQVQQRLYKHREHCAISFDFSLDKNEVHYATVLYGLTDQPELAQQAVLDLTYFSSNGKTQVIGYTYYGQQQFLVDAFLQALAKPEVCAEGIAKKE